MSNSAIPTNHATSSLGLTILNKFPFILSRVRHWGPTSRADVFSPHLTPKVFLRFVLILAYRLWLGFWTVFVPSVFLHSFPVFPVFIVTCCVSSYRTLHSHLKICTPDVQCSWHTGKLVLLLEQKLKITIALLLSNNNIYCIRTQNYRGAESRHSFNLKSFSNAEASKLHKTNFPCFASLHENPTPFSTSCAYKKHLFFYFFFFFFF